jgi:hypothetical protein
MTARIFETGATRDTEEGKLDYEGFLSPLVLQRYAEYMNKHRVQSDGKLRASDNWQNLFGPHHYDVCLKSLLRHTMDVWLYHRKFEKAAREEIEDALCAILFNCMAYLFKLLKEKYENSTKEIRE